VAHSRFSVQLFPRYLTENDEDSLELVRLRLDKLFIW